jgi:hypothetical protein|nr:hypothetical protein [Prevotella sp.]
MKNYDDSITDHEYHMLMACLVIAIPMVLDAIIRIQQLAEMVGGK